MNFGWNEMYTGTLAKDARTSFPDMAQYFC